MHHNHIKYWDAHTHAHTQTRTRGMCDVMCGLGCTHNGDERGGRDWVVILLFWGGRCDCCCFVFAHISLTFPPSPIFSSPQTALHSATANGCKEVVSLLLERGANVNARDVWSSHICTHTCLWLGCLYLGFECVDV